MHICLCGYINGHEHAGAPEAGRCLWVCGGHEHVVPLGAGRCLCGYVVGMGMQVPLGVEEGIKSFGVGVISGFEPSDTDARN